MLRSRADLVNITGVELLMSPEQFRHNSWDVEMVFRYQLDGFFWLKAVPVEKLVSVGVAEDSTSGSLWELVHC